MADAGEIIAGPIGREVLGAAQVIFMIFVCGSHVLTGLIAFDTSKLACYPSSFLSYVSRQLQMVHHVPFFGLEYLQ